MGKIMESRDIKKEIHELNVLTPGFTSKLNMYGSDFKKHTTGLEN